MVLISADGDGDVTMAQLAMEPVNAYSIEIRADLLSAAQIVAFGLATFGSPSLTRHPMQPPNAQGSRNLPSGAQ